MAGTIIVSAVKTDNDNSISFLANTGDVIFTANTSHGIPGSYIEAGTITADKIADGTVIAADIADGAVTGPKLGQNSINANNIVNGTITTGKFASSANSAITGKSVAMAIVFGG